MKLKTAALVFLLCVLLTGCTSGMGMDLQSLMRPPRPTGEKQEIHEVLDVKAGSYKLQYPYRGEHRSSIIMNDLTGDGVEEALVLYQGLSETGITVMFIGKQQGEWVELGSYTSQATQVDQVCFGDVNSDGRDEAIIGWGNVVNSASDICVYSLQNGSVSEISLNLPYSEMVVMDFDGDGGDEIFTASITSAEQQASARLIRIRGGVPETMGTASLDATVSYYIGVSAGLINEYDLGVVLDGMKSSGTSASYVTELLYWDDENKILQTPFYDPNTLSANYMRRFTSVTSRDVNGDGLIEIPIVNPLPGYTAPAPDETCYITNWHRYDNRENMLERVVSMVVNSRDGYSFVIPDMWREQVTTQADSQNSSLTFYEWIPSDAVGNGAMGAALLRIQVFSEESWVQGKGTEGFTELERSGGMVYAASVPVPENSLALSLEDVANGFDLLYPQEG